MKIVLSEELQSKLFDLLESKIIPSVAFCCLLAFMYGMGTAFFYFFNEFYFLADVNFSDIAGFEKLLFYSLDMGAKLIVGGCFFVAIAIIFQILKSVAQFINFVKNNVKIKRS